jgi:hypothetical protein
MGHQELIAGETLSKEVQVQVVEAQSLDALESPYEISELADERIAIGLQVLSND